MFAWLRLTGPGPRVVVLVVVAFLQLGAGASTATAQDRSSEVPSIASASQGPVAAAQTSGFATAVCQILEEPVAVGINRLIGLFTRARVHGTLAGTLFAQLGFNPWCKSAYPKLRSRLQGVVRRRPALRPRIGPFVFGLHATADVISQFQDRVRVSWFQYTISSPLRHYFLWYSQNGRRFLPAPNGSPILDFGRGNVVQFAVRVDDQAGGSSPWVYSVRYRLP
jgi:hypothetical protein